MNSTTKQNPGYNTYEISFPLYVVTGLMDSDGHYYIRIREGAGDTKKYEISAKFTQQKLNEDTVYSMRTTLGGSEMGAVHNYPGRDDRQPKVELAVAFSTLENNEKGKDWLDNYPPLIMGKRRDFLIAKLVRDHQRNNYKIFKTLENCADLKNELSRFSPVEKRKAGTIACLFLREHTYPATQKTPKEKEKSFETLENNIESMTPMPSTKSFGKKLGEYFLSCICQEERALNNTLLDKNYSLPDDYIVGLYIGDGSLEFRVRFNPNININFRFSITVSKDSRSILKAIQRKIDGGTIIEKNNGSNFQFSLDARGIIKNKVVPLLGQFKMPYAKQRQLNIIKELLVLIDQDKHKNKTGLLHLIELWAELGTLHQAQRTKTKDQLQQEGLGYLERNGLL